MTRTLLFVFAAILVVACTTTPEGGDATAAARCEISEQSRSLNATLSQAAGDNLDAIVRANAPRIASLAEEAVGGATGQRTPAREASCRAIALRAYGALLRSPDHEETAVEAIAVQSEAGSHTCAAIANHDAGTRADCDLINMWVYTIDGFKAARQLQAINASLTPGGASVDETLWNRVNSEARIVQDAVNHWAESPPVQTPAMTDVVAAQRTRMVCATWAPLMRMRDADRSGSAAWRRVYGDTYPALMRDAANALVTSQSETQARVDELERVCGQLQGG